MRVGESGGEPDLLAEPVRAHCVSQLGWEHLDYDLAIERNLGRQEHARHAATAQLALDSEGRDEGGLKSLHHHPDGPAGSARQM